MKMNKYDQTMLNAIFFAAKRFRENEENDLVSTVKIIEKALDELKESDYYKKCKLKES